MEDILAEGVSDVNLTAVLFEDLYYLGGVVEVRELDGVYQKGVLLIVHYLVPVGDPLQECTQALGVVLVCS